MDTLVGLLREKGADVYFVQLPSSAEVHLLEAAFFPRNAFWNAMEERLDDATFIHADDYPEMGGFMSQDGSHIDSARIVEFTELLAAVIQAHEQQSR
jgi:hypothetical protein